MLDGFLEFYRLTLLHKCAGSRGANGGAQRRTSGLSLLGLIRHMAGVERVWFEADSPSKSQADLLDRGESRRRLRGRGRSGRAGRSRAYQRELDLARETAAGRSLDDTFRSRNGDEDISLRWVYLHVIEEYARHSGHADLIRERIDGAKGE